MIYSCCSGAAAPTRNEAKEHWLFRMSVGFPWIAGYTYMSRANVCINCYLPYTMEYFAAYNNKMYYYQIKECCGTYQKGGNCFTLNRVIMRARQLHNQVGLWRKVAWFVLLRSELQHEAKGWTPLLRQIQRICLASEVFMITRNTSESCWRSFGASMSNMKELAPVTGAGHSLTAGCSKTTSKELVVHFGPTGKASSL